MNTQSELNQAKSSNESSPVKSQTASAGKESPSSTKLPKTNKVRSPSTPSRKSVSRSSKYIDLNVLAKKDSLTNYELIKAMILYFHENFNSDYSPKAVIFWSVAIKHYPEVFGNYKDDTLKKYFRNILNTEDVR